MLVLSRQRDEAIVIGDEVEITIVDIRGDKVRLGITAPRAVQVHRKEIYEAIRGENDAARCVELDDLDGADNDLRPCNPLRVDRSIHIRGRLPGRRHCPDSSPARITGVE